MSKQLHNKGVYLLCWSRALTTCLRALWQDSSSLCVIIEYFGSIGTLLLKPVASQQEHVVFGSSSPAVVMSFLLLFTVFHNLTGG